MYVGTPFLASSRDVTLFIIIMTNYRLLIRFTKVRITSYGMSRTESEKRPPKKLSAG